MAPTLYLVYPSPPVRAVLITAKALGLELNEKVIDLTKGDHLTPEFLKLNPQHTVPTLVDDDGFVLWDSHAIIFYLVTKYGKNQSALLPTDLKQRAVVEQRLHFDSGVLFSAVLQAVRAVFRGLSNKIDEEGKERLSEGYAFLETFLEGKEWAAGDVLTVADYSLIATVTSANVVVPISRKQHPNISKWMEKVKARPEYGVNEAGLKGFSDYLATNLQ